MRQTKLIRWYLEDLSQNHGIITGYNKLCGNWIVETTVGHLDINCLVGERSLPPVGTKVELWIPADSDKFCGWVLTLGHTDLQELNVDPMMIEFNHWEGTMYFILKLLDFWCWRLKLKYLANKIGDFANKLRRHLW